MKTRTKIVLLLTATVIVIFAITFNLVYEVKSNTLQRFTTLTSQKVGEATVLSIIEDNVTHETFYLMEPKQFTQTDFFPTSEAPQISKK